MENTQFTPEELDALFNQSTSKYNTSVKITEADRRDGVRVLCKEPYAQELYDLYSKYDGGSQFTSKDFTVGQLCSVIAKSIDFENKVIIADEKFSKSTIFIPFREFTEEPSLLLHDGDLREFKVVITRAEAGDYLGSERRCAAITYRDNLNSFMKEDKWFYVKVTSLVKGGYLALYKGTVKCFLPGSHAAANVIRDFNDYLNTEIPVMIENFDAANDLFIVSYKKYIKHTLPQKVYELEFGKEYTGILTNNPYDFGIFVEFQNYYTGLIHKSEFENYADFANGRKSGDEIKFYIKDIIIKKGEPRIVLTDSLDKVDHEKVQWQSLKDRVEGHTLNFTLDKEDFALELEMPDEDLIFRTDVSHLKGRIRIPESGQVKIVRVDTFRKNLKFDFLQA
jgi:ribosomal protein S1